MNIEAGSRLVDHAVQRSTFRIQHSTFAVSPLPAPYSFSLRSLLLLTTLYPPTHLMFVETQRMLASMTRRALPALLLLAACAAPDDRTVDPFSTTDLPRFHLTELVEVGRDADGSAPPLNRVTDAEFLGSESAAVVLIGDGTVTVGVSDTLDVTINGSGTVGYRGSPQVIGPGTQIDPTPPACP